MKPTLQAPKTYPQNTPNSLNAQRRASRGSQKHRNLTTPQASSNQHPSYEQQGVSLFDMCAAIYQQIYAEKIQIGSTSSQLTTEEFTVAYNEVLKNFRNDFDYMQKLADDLNSNTQQGQEFLAQACKERNQMMPKNPSDKVNPLLNACMNHAYEVNVIIRSCREQQTNMMRQGSFRTSPTGKESDSVVRLAAAVHEQINQNRIRSQHSSNQFYK